MTNASNEDQPRVTAAELVEVITKHPGWANLPVHMLNMTDDAVWLTEVEYDCFDVNEGPVLSLLAHAPAVPGGEPAPSYGAVLARAEDAERHADELLAEVEHLRAQSAEIEQQAREWEAAEVQRPSMYAAAAEAAAGVLPDAPIATVEQVALAVLRVALPLHETQHADAWKAAHERAVHFEWELTKCVELLGYFVNHEDQPCRFDHHGACREHGGSSLRRCDVAVGRELVARVRRGGGGAGCLCPHTYQPDGRLVRDGVLAAGCPVHDADVRENDNA